MLQNVTLSEWVVSDSQILPHQILAHLWNWHFRLANVDSCVGHLDMDWLQKLISCRAIFTARFIKIYPVVHALFCLQGDAQTQAQESPLPQKTTGSYFEGKRHCVTRISVRTRMKTKTEIIWIQVWSKFKLEKTGLFDHLTRPAQHELTDPVPVGSNHGPRGLRCCMFWMLGAPDLTVLVIDRFPHNFNTCRRAGETTKAGRIVVLEDQNWTPLTYTVFCM